VRAGQWAVVPAVDVALRALPGRGFARRSVVDVHTGSGEQGGRLRLLDDAGSFARLRLDTPLPLAPGDRLILRSSGARATVGGAVVLDVAPARRTGDALTRLTRSVTERVFDARPWVTPDEFAMLAGRAATEADGVQAGAWLTTPAELERVRARAAELSRDGWPAITVVATACNVEVAQLRAAIGDTVADSPLEDRAAAPLIDALNASPFSPPLPSELGASPALVRALVRAGALVDLDGVLFTAAAFESARTRIAHAVVEREELTVADVRDLLESSRKFVLPLLERMDTSGVTRRRGDVRIPGPRATDY
jgi:selenocysteine-specific elongation factor